MNALCIITPQLQSMPEMSTRIGRRLDRPLLRAEQPQPRMTKHPHLSCVCILTSDPNPGLPPHCLCNDACVTRNRRRPSLHSHSRAAPVTSAPSLARLPSRESWSCIIPNARAPTHSTDRRVYHYRAHFTHETSILPSHTLWVSHSKVPTPQPK